MKDVLTINGIPLDKSFIFSGGEVQIRLPKFNLIDFSIKVETILNSSDKIMELILVSEALNYYYPSTTKRLTIHYLPYARQDRRCYEGEAFSSKVMMDKLLQLGFFEINVLDVHSDQNLPSVFNEKTVLDLFKQHPNILNNIDAVVIPDKGAMCKVGEIADYFKLPVIVADKIRNPENGNLEGIEIVSGLESIYPHVNLMVIDDICDGGGTFGMLSDSITNIESDVKLNLFITHGIFSKGMTPLSGYDTVTTTDSICSLDPEFIVEDEPTLNIIKL